MPLLLSILFPPKTPGKKSSIFLLLFSRVPHNFLWIFFGRRIFCFIFMLFLIPEEVHLPMGCGYVRWEPDRG